MEETTQIMRYPETPKASLNTQHARKRLNTSRARECRSPDKSYGFNFARGFIGGS